jgi:hypothetical protein
MNHVLIHTPVSRKIIIRIINQNAYTRAERHRQVSDMDYYHGPIWLSECNIETQRSPLADCGAGSFAEPSMP